MKAPERKPPASAPARKPPTPSSEAPDRFAPAEVARRAVAMRPTTPTGRIKYAVTLVLPREVAEYLTERALREGSSVPWLISELLIREAAARRAS